MRTIRAIKQKGAATRQRAQLSAVLPQGAGAGVGASVGAPASSAAAMASGQRQRKKAGLGKNGSEAHSPAALVWGRGRGACAWVRALGRAWHELAALQARRRTSQAAAAHAHVASVPLE